MITPLCPHGRTYGTCLMCYHDLVAEQQSQIERLQRELRNQGYTPAQVMWVSEGRGPIGAGSRSDNST